MTGFSLAACGGSPPAFGAARIAALGAAAGFHHGLLERGGETMSDEEFECAGGNLSAAHVDFMIGSGELDVNGVLPDGTIEPVMRRGEWL